MDIINNTLTKEDYIRYSNLIYELRKRPFKDEKRGNCKTAIDIIRFISENHLESEYNRIDNILYKNGFIGAVLALYATYICYFDIKGETT